ncbi:MAG: hypothetical protein ACJ8AO_11000 [Gemmatimonadaceae bacterium]
MHRMHVRRAALVVAAVLVAGCDRASASSARDSVATLTTRLEDAEKAARDREAIAQELAQTTKLLADIDTEVSKVRGLKLPAKKKGAPADDPWVARHDSLVGKVHGVAVLLQRARGRVDQLSKENKSLGKEIAGYRETIASLEALTKRQEEQVIALTQEVDSLRGVNTILASERDQERETARGLRDTANTVYYVVGTKEQLVKAGVITEEGRKRFMVFGARGLVPARKLNRKAFTRADMREPIEIPLPAAGSEFKVISRHDASLLDVPANGGKPSNRVRVLDPEEFWASSHYLIIVTAS